MSGPSLIDILDSFSPLVTLGFGIYCAVNDTKPENGKLSKAGKIALWGMIISGLITIVVKVHELNVKLQEQQDEITTKDNEAKEKEALKKTADSLNTINREFQKAAIDSLSKSIGELNNIKSASEHTLSSLDIVTDKQQLALENTRRSLNPLLPLKITLNYSVNMKKFKEINVNTAHYIIAIENYIRLHIRPASFKYFRLHNRNWQQLDTVNIPLVDEIDLLDKSLVPEVEARYRNTRRDFEILYFTNRFTINLRKNNSDQGIESQTSFSFGSDKTEYTDVTLNIDKGMLHIQLTAENPIILNKQSDDFISLYDLQNAVIGFANGNSQTKSAEIFTLNEITIYTGFDFSRKTTLKFKQQDKSKCCGETYARKIELQEIK